MVSNACGASGVTAEARPPAPSAVYPPAIELLRPAARVTMSAMADSANSAPQVGVVTGLHVAPRRRRQRDHQDPLHRPIRRLRRRSAVCTHLRRNLEGEGRDHAERDDRRGAADHGSTARSGSTGSNAASSRGPRLGRMRSRSVVRADARRSRWRASTSTSATRSARRDEILDQPGEAAQRDRRRQRGQERTWEEAVTDRAGAARTRAPACRSGTPRCDRGRAPPPWRCRCSKVSPPTTMTAGADERARAGDDRRACGCRRARTTRAAKKRNVPYVKRPTPSDASAAANRS